MNAMLDSTTSALNSHLNHQDELDSREKAFGHRAREILMEQAEQVFPDDCLTLADCLDGMPSDAYELANKAMQVGDHVALASLLIAEHKRSLELIRDQYIVNHLPDVVADLDEASQ